MLRMESSMYLELCIRRCQQMRSSWLTQASRAELSQNPKHEPRIPNLKEHCCWKCLDE